MTGPIDAVTALHNAFRRDIDDIDAAQNALEQCGARNISLVLSQLHAAVR